MTQTIFYPDGYTIALPRGIEGHVHFRQEPILAVVAPFTADQFAYAVAMGNTFIHDADDAFWHKQQILDAVRSTSSEPFEPIMTIMLTKRTTVKTIRDAHRAGIFRIKLIPANTSTNSGDEGLTLSGLITEKFDVLLEMQRLRMRLLLHAELIKDADGKPIPEKERERKSIPLVSDIIGTFPDLIISIEHASTRPMIELVKAAPPNVTGTLTFHHAIVKYSDVYDAQDNLIDPLLRFLPVAKDPDDIRAVRETMTSAHPKFGPGGDSAPHFLRNKMVDFAAGVFTAPVMLQSGCEIFEEENALPKLSDFIMNGLRNNDLKPHGEVVMKRHDWSVPRQWEGIPIFRGGETLRWQLEIYAQ